MLPYIFQKYHDKLTKVFRDVEYGGVFGIISPNDIASPILYVFFFFLVALFFKNSIECSKQYSQKILFNISCSFAFIFAIIQLYASDYQETFLYFNF